jgi:DNA-binding CsgD family transcriptional regulator
VYSPEHKNRIARRLYHHNRGYAVGEVLQFAVNINS